MSRHQPELVSVGTAWAGEARAAAGRIARRPAFFDRFGETSADLGWEIELQRGSGSV